MTRFRRAIAVPLAVALVLAPALGARAEGSVPSEVSAYVADGSLVAQLNDVYGVDAAGGGIDFDDTTKPGVIERVHVFSEALREGEETDHPLDLVNRWIVPISIADEPVGLATIWINPASVVPELAGFVADPELAVALSAVPDGQSLVQDEISSAWLALAADGILTPLVAGTTGLSTPVPIDDIALLPSGGSAPSAAGDPNTGVGFAIAVILLLLAVIVVALVLPTLRKRAPEEPSDGEPAAEPVNDEPGDAAADPAVDPVQAAAPATGTKPRKPRKPPTAAAAD